MKSLAKVTQDSIPVSKFDNDQVNHSPGTMKELKESTPKLDGDGTLLQPHQVHLRRGGNHLKIGDRHGVGMSSDFSFNPSVNGVTLTCATKSVNTAQTHAYVALPHTCFFLAWLKT